MRTIVLSLLLVLCFSGRTQNIKVLNNYKYLYVRPYKQIKPKEYLRTAVKLREFFVARGFNVVLDKDSVPENEIAIVTYKCEKEANSSTALISTKGTTVDVSVTFSDYNGNKLFECTSVDYPKYGGTHYSMNTETTNTEFLLDCLEKPFFEYKHHYKPGETSVPITQNNAKRDAEEVNLPAGKAGKTEEKPAEKPVTNQPAKGKTPEKKPVEATNDLSTESSSYYALLIGVSDYADPNIPDLEGLPIKDAEKLANVLLTKYTFKKENVTTLKNPTRRELVIALDDLSKNLTPEDNVLIFYAGHGHYEEDNQIGYWLPKDAEVGNTSNWLYNDQLVASIKKIKSKHTLLITDACFSGSIFKTRSVSMEKAGDAIKKKYELPSRKAITSGTLKTVPNVSVFMKYVLDRLDKNKEKYYSASQLFQSIEIPVGNNSPTTPQYGVIQNVGDEGGDFIFIKK